MGRASSIAFVGFAAWTGGVLGICCGGTGEIGAPTSPVLTGVVAADGAADRAVPRPPCDPSSTAALQRTFFVPRCARAGCHAPPDPVAGLDLARADLEAHLAGRPAEECTGKTTVLAGDPDASYLIEKITLEKPACGSRMPEGEPALELADVACVRAWISGLSSSDAGPDAEGGGDPDGG